MMSEDNDFNENDDQRAIHGLLLEQAYHREGVSDQLASRIIKEVRTTRRPARPPWMLYAWIAAAAASVALVAWFGAKQLQSREPKIVDTPRKPGQKVVEQAPERKPNPPKKPETFVNKQPEPKTPDPVPEPQRPDAIVVKKPDPVPELPKPVVVKVATVLTDGLDVLRKERVALNRGDSVFADERLIARNEAEVRFKDGSTLKLAAGAVCVLWKPKAQDRADVQLLLGKAEFAVIMGQDRFLTDARAVIVSFGGEFTVERSAGSTTVAVDKGAVAATSAGTTIRVLAGQTAEAADGKRPVLAGPSEPSIVQKKPPQQPKADVFAGVPVAVANTMKRRFPRMDVTSVKKERDGRNFVYRIRGKSDNKETEMMIASDGKVIEAGGKNRYAGLPIAVANTLKRRFPGMDIAKVEREERGRIYKIKGKSGKKEIEIKIASDGRIIDGGGKRKEDDKKKEDDDHKKKEHDD